MDTRPNRKLLIVPYICALLIFAISPEVGSAAQSCPENADCPEQEKSRYSTYKPNYALLYSRRQGDDEAISVRLSGRYTWLDCDRTTATRFCNSGIITDKDNRKFQSFLSYTHDFDFYLYGSSELGRPSEPVVNRMTSPGIHFEWIPGNPWPTSYNRLKVGSRMLSVVHHSNGQSLDKKTQFNDAEGEVLQNELVVLEDRNRAWRDTISRGWNYIEAKVKLTHLHSIDEEQQNGSGSRPLCKEDFRCGNYFISGKRRIFPISDDIWWEPGNSSRFSDYNIIEFTYSNEFKRETSDRYVGGEINFSLSCGWEGCGVTAWKRFDLKFPFKNVELPWLLYVRDGPNEHFYNYHEDTFNIGIGLQFRP